MKRWLIALILVLFLSSAVMAHKQKEVGPLIKDTVDAVLVIVRNKELEQQTKKDKIMDVIMPVFDLPLMAKLTLGRKYWPKLTDKQKEGFTDLFVKQLQASYFEKIELFSDEKVEFKEPVKHGKKYYLLTHVLSKDRVIKLAYKLYKAKMAWKVYDIEIEDVSIVKSYGLQYDQVLQEGSVKDLLKKMREKIEALKREPRGEERIVESVR